MVEAEDYLQIRAQQGEVTEFAEGFGLKAILAGLFVAFVVTPGSMFMWLMLGQQLGTPAVWVTLIIFLEIAKRCRTTLSRQEMFVIWSVTWGILGAAVMEHGMTFIWMQYFVRSDAAVQFEIANQIPFWKAPPPGSAAYTMRNLLHRDWWPAIALMGFFILWGRLSYFSLGYVLFRVTSDVERLPFPLAPIRAKGVVALAESEQETWRWRCFSIGSTIGIAFGLLYVGVPVLSGVFLRKEIYLIQVPFYDLTKQLQDVPWFRAVPMAIGTNLGGVFYGFVLPFPVVIGGFLAGVLGRLLLNPILYRLGVLEMWEPGMDYIETGLANQFDFWLSFSIGTVVAVALLGFYAAASRALRARRERKEAGTPTMLGPPPGRGDIPIPVALLFYVATTAWMILLCHWLVPKFPIWILLAFGFGYTPLMSYVSARLNGLTGHQVGVPYVREAALVLSGYKGVDVWFAPLPMADVGPGAAHFREVELTGTKFTSIFKAQVFLLPVAVVCSLLFWSFFYKISDIPEDYPFAMRFWPAGATVSAFWMTATTTGNAFFLKAIRFPFIAAGAGYGLLMYPFLRVIGAPTLFVYGTIQGLVGDPAMQFPTLAGALLGRYYMAKVFGKTQWPEYTPVLAAGFACGMGLVGMGSVALQLIARAVTMVPF
jgi:hypothetical protein